MSQSATFLGRFDLTADWAVAVVTAILALSFESRGSYLLFIGMVALSKFLILMYADIVYTMSIGHESVLSKKTSLRTHSTRKATTYELARKDR
nr:DUF2270 domain-containing protein [Haladaptatus pallidirubidus]